jgi:Flp pilus assembly pilin Flp
MFADALNRSVVRLYLAMRREEGQTFVEYSLIAAVVGLGLIVGLGAFKDQIATALNTIGGKL